MYDAWLWLMDGGRIGRKTVTLTTSLQQVFPRNPMRGALVLPGGRGTATSVQIAFGDPPAAGTYNITSSQSPFAQIITFLDLGDVLQEPVWAMIGGSGDAGWTAIEYEWDPDRWERMFAHYNRMFAQL